MSTRSIISIDATTKSGFYKRSDGFPASTIPSIFTYIGFFGYNAFAKECNRINKKGACSYFYYTSEVFNANFREVLFDMIVTHQLSDELFNYDLDDRTVDCQAYGYLITPTTVKIYKGSMTPIVVVKYSEEELKDIVKANLKNIIRGVFEDFSLEDVFIEKYHIQN